MNSKTGRDQCRNMSTRKGQGMTSFRLIMISALIITLLFSSSFSVFAEDTVSPTPAPGSETPAPDPAPAPTPEPTPAPTPEPKPDRLSSSEIKAMFSYESFTGSQLTIPYRKAVIHAELAEPPALVICLHGKSDSGKNNKRQMSNRGIQNSTRYFYTMNRKAIILAPQCSTKHKWYDSKMLPTLRELIAAYEGSVDRNRIYIIGESFGGYGTWAMLSHYPQLFAAGLTAAAYVKGEIYQIKNTPFCAVMGKKDKTVSEKKISAVIQQMISLGAQVRYVAIPKASHSTTCSQAFSDENLAWVFSHTAGVRKADNTLDVRGLTTTVSHNKLDNGIKILARKRVLLFTSLGQGKKLYYKVKGNKKIQIDNRTGKVTLKKGLGRGSHKVKIQVIALGNSQYLASPVKNITFTIIIK